MALSNSKEYWFPAELYGNPKEVGRAWRKVFRQACSSSDWAEFFERLSCKCIRRDVDKIVFCDISGGHVAEQAHWQVYWVAKVFPLTGIHSLGFDERHFSRFSECMRHLWFTLGTLDVSACQPTFWHNDKISQNTIKSMLRWYVYWLPEIIDLFPLLAIMSAFTVIPQSEHLPNYLGSIMIAAHKCGYILPSPNDLFRDFGPSGSGDLVAMLLEHRVIVRKGERYELRE